MAKKFKKPRIQTVWTWYGSFLKCAENRWFSVKIENVLGRVRVRLVFMFDVRRTVFCAHLLCCSSHLKGVIPSLASSTTDG